MYYQFASESNEVYFAGRKLMTHKILEEIIMSLHRYCFILLLALLLIPGILFASDSKYSYISATDLETRLTANLPINIVDIQVEEEFAQHHIKGAIPTHAYPVKSDADHSKLNATIEQLKANTDPVVIVCPRGAGGAKRTYDYLLQKEVSTERLLILEKGQSGWASTPLTESN
jgi:thiosulfate/3-mercaptopyruvate sulfurtransferase